MLISDWYLFLIKGRNGWKFVIGKRKFIYKSLYDIDIMLICNISG
nr:MAG TPA: hypothetical protein [Caudoviricetes sp.]